MSFRFALAVVVVVILALGSAVAFYELKLRHPVDLAFGRIHVPTGEPATSNARKPQVVDAITVPLPNFDTVAPKLDFQAKLDGDATMLVINMTNESPNTYVDIALSGLTLGKIQPRERTALPLRVARLTVGASKQFVLHYDNVEWLNDSVKPDRLDLSWAQQPLDVSSSWISLINPSDTSDPRIRPKPLEAKGSINTPGIPIQLNETDAMVLKARRDAVVKAREADPFTGQWIWSLEVSPGSHADMAGSFTNDVKGVSGNISWAKPGAPKIDFNSAKTNGNKIEFRIVDTQPEATTTLTFSGTSDGDRITGKVFMLRKKTGGSSIFTSIPWTASRISTTPAAKKP